MSCQTCQSEDVVSISAKHADCFFISHKGHESNGYAPHIHNVCAGDYSTFKLCLSCGQIQGKWPQSIPAVLKPPKDCGESESGQHLFQEQVCIHCGMVEL